MDLKRILVFRIGHLGDTIVSLPAFWRVRREFPEAHITLLSNADSQNPTYVSARDVLPEWGLFDAWMSYPANVSRARKAAAFSRLLLDLRRVRFDAAIYLMPRNRTPRQVERDLAFFRLAGISRVFGARYLKDHYDALNEGPIAGETECEYLLHGLNHDGFPDTAEFCFDLSLNENEYRIADNWLSEKVRSDKSELIAVAPGSKWPSKIWHEDRYFEVVDNIVRDRDVVPIVFGGPEDADVGDRLIERWGRGANAAGDLNVRVAAAALGRCALYLGNDTGTMHLAAAVGTPCVAIFAAIDQANRWKPFGVHNALFRTRVECEVCLSPECFNDNICLRQINAEDVFEACIRSLRDHMKVEVVV